MYFMPYICNQLGYKLEWGLFLYILIHDESVFAIYVSINVKWKPAGSYFVKKTGTGTHTI